jgi:hypothetical protein
LSNQNDFDSLEQAAEQAREQYNGEGGLAGLESSLGLTANGDESGRIGAVIEEVRRRVVKWEGSPAKELLRDHEAISRLFTVTEKVHVASYVNNGRLPGFWWSRLAIALDGEALYDRLLTQIHRETAAQSAQHAAMAMADTPTGAKLVGPNCESALLAAARRAAAEVAQKIDELEKLDNAGLMANSNTISEWHDCLVERFIFNAPTGMPHEAQVLEYREWMRLRFVEFQTEWTRIVNSIPDNGFVRLLELLTRVNHGEAAARFLSDSTTASANARWQRLEPVKKWAFEQRRNNPGPSRAAVIRNILSEVKERAKAEKEPLTGSDEAVVRTVTDWFRKAGIT